MDFGEYGSIVIEVDGKEAPRTADNFMKLVNDGFYDGLTIFRAQEDFVIQGGRDFAVNLAPVVGEFAANGYENDISHLRGVISMARANDPNSATSQFFITLHDQATRSLDGRYAAFGKVVEGMDVVDAIAEALMECSSDGMGFVYNADDEIEIVSAKQLKNYKK
jgi:peptidyl-prolyl cis-trans isomerase B (cyclophilin B)